MAWSFVRVERIEPPSGGRWRALVTVASDNDPPDVESYFIEFLAPPTDVDAAAAGQARADALNAAEAAAAGAG